MVEDGLGRQAAVGVEPGEEGIDVLGGDGLNLLDVLICEEANKAAVGMIVVIHGILAEGARLAQPNKPSRAVESCIGGASGYHVDCAAMFPRA